MLTFLIGGALGGLVFAVVTTKNGLGGVWFVTVEWWVFPTLKFWLFGAAIFFVSIAASYAFAVSFGWLKAPTKLSRLLVAAALGAVLPFILDLLSKPGFSIPGFFLRPLLVALLLSAALWLLSSKWYKSLTLLVIIIYVAAPMVAGIPDLLVSEGCGLSDGVTSFLRLTLLASLSGWWLARATGT